MEKQANEKSFDEKQMKDNLKDENGSSAENQPKESPEVQDSPSVQKEETAETSVETDSPETDLADEQLKKIDEQAKEIEKLKKEKEDLNNRLLRNQADFDNFRKRVNKEKADNQKFRAQKLVSDLLETLDNFNRALAVETVSEDGKALKKGMEMVLDKMVSALKKEGVEEIEALGKPFDPNLHQAVMQEESADHESGVVIQVLQSGYTLNGRVIRPSMVKVSA